MINQQTWPDGAKLRQGLGRFFGATNRLIVANASAMMGTMVITSGLGALYWLLAARFFDTEAVGLAGASISTMTLLGTAGMLGLGTLLIGELPRQRGQEVSFIATALVVSGLTGALGGALFALLVPIVSPNLRALAADPLTAALFALGVSLTSVTMVLDQALIGLLRGELQLWRNTGFAVIKLGALAAIALSLGSESWRTIYGTWILGNLLSLIGLGSFIIWRWSDLRGHQLRPQWGLLRRFGRAALGHHSLNMALQLPGLALPLVVTSLLSATANAYYYAAAIAVGPFFFGTLALVTALYAVGSRSPEALAQRIRFTLGIALSAGVVGNLVLLFGADLLLRLFGDGYAAQAGLTLRLLGLCVFPIIIKDHYVTLSRIHGRLLGTAILATAGGGVELGLAALGAIGGGLPGLVIGWLVALFVEAILMSPTVYRAARGDTGSPHATATQHDDRTVGEISQQREVARVEVNDEVIAPEHEECSGKVALSTRGNARTRVVGLSRGNPYSPHDGSGVPLNLFNALERRYSLVRRVDARLPHWQKALVALTTLHPSRIRWTERYFKSLLAFKLLSRNSRRILKAIGQPYDIALQFNGLFRTCGAPYIVYLDITYHDAAQAWPEWSPLRGQQLTRWYAQERALYHDALHLFSMSEFAARSLRSFYGVSPERISVVGGGVNIGVRKVPERAAAGQPPTILFVGKEFRRKGGDCLIEAFRQVRAALPEARLQIIGTEEVPAEPGVEVLGRISDREQLAQCYAEVAVFCLPSRFDPFPGVLIEAMAHGLPCVSTTVCGIPEIVIEGQTGLLVPPDDSAALATALLRLLNDPAYAARLGAAGRQRTEEELNWDRVIDRMAPILDSFNGLYEHQRVDVTNPVPPASSARQIVRYGGGE